MHTYNGNNKVERSSSFSTSRKRQIREVRKVEVGRKRAKLEIDYFEGLPDDLVLCVLSKVSTSANAPLDLVNALLTCKRFNELGFHPLVLSKAGKNCLAIRAKNWSETAHSFLKRCVDAGNLEACFILGMIRFYCLESRGTGASLMAKAAIGLHCAALYSLAIIQFNGSGGTKNDKDLRAGVALCARAASLGQIDALRELGHCLQDGYGVRRNVKEGRRLLFQANTCELVAAQANQTSRTNREIQTTLVHCPLLSDYGCYLPAPEPHPANRFLAEWFTGNGLKREAAGLRLCSHSGCGRPETRRHEFRRCAVCGAVNYCSRACQALDWKLNHKVNCAVLQQLLMIGNGGNLPVGNGVEAHDAVVAENVVVASAQDVTVIE